MKPIGKNIIELIQLLKRFPVGTRGQKVIKTVVKRHICFSSKKGFFLINIEFICLKNK